MYSDYKVSYLVFRHFTKCFSILKQFVLFLRTPILSSPVYVYMILGKINNNHPYYITIFKWYNSIQITEYLNGSTQNVNIEFLFFLNWFNKINSMFHVLCNILDFKTTHIRSRFPLKSTLIKICFGALRYYNIVLTL